MRIKKLYITGYKNLHNLTIDFEAGNGLTMLIGNNGSGKSNILEAISGIFHDAYKKSSERKINGADCEYRIEYSFDDDKTYVIKREHSTLRFFVDGTQKRRENFIRNYMPKNVIGLYSGEETRLHESFYKSYYNAYMQRLTLGLPIVSMKLMFVDKNYWNIALLTLLLSQNPTIAPFIENDLQIRTVDRITIGFNMRYYYNCNNELLKAFIDRINPNHETIKEFSLVDLKRITSENTVLAEEHGDQIVFGNDTHILIGNGLSDQELFQYLVQANMPKSEKMISHIQIAFNGGITTDQLSEGEKKLVLVKTILEIIADEKSLLLLDEPDANLHEGRKSALYRIIKEYPNRQVILATHSSMLSQIASENELVMLECCNGETVLLNIEKIARMQKLFGETWTTAGQSLLLHANKPLVIFEGKTDVKYTKQAIRFFQDQNKFTDLNVDFLNANGSGNAKFFIDNLLPLVSSDQKIIAFFDRDDGGKKGAAAVSGKSKDSEEIVHFQDIVLDNIIISFIPYKTGINSGDFLIEDYFPWEPTVKRIVDQITPENKHPYKSLPELPKRIKSEIERKYLDFSANEYLDFEPLLQKIYELSHDVV